MMKLLLVPVVIVACAYSWLTYFFGRPADKEVYWSDRWGWTSKAMDPAWADFRNREDSSLYHELKNLGAEWARAWPQTAAKAGSFLLVLNGLIGLAIGILLGLSL